MNECPQCESCTAENNRQVNGGIGPRLCENYRGGGKTTKMAEFMASLVELSHKYIAFKKRAVPKRDELRVFTQPRPLAEVVFEAKPVL